MKILFASDSFKGTLSSADTIRLLTAAAKEVLPECETVGVPIADGGEGTLAAVIQAKTGKYHHVLVSDPLGNEIEASYGSVDQLAIIEMAQASGLPLIPEGKKNPLIASTYGTGQLIKDALTKGFRKIYIAIGGSATNDGGMGAMSALGIKFLDHEGNCLAGSGEALAQVAAIDCSGLMKEVKNTQFYVMCDVNNPLIGKTGATYIFGPQKGATEEMLSQLERGMTKYAQVVAEQTGVMVANQPGGGAAGGLGAALYAFLGAQMISGIDAVLDIISYDELIKDVDIVITGEGKFDQQSLYGKAIYGISSRNKKKGIPTIVLSGSIELDETGTKEGLVDAAMATICYPMTIAEACENAEKLYKAAAQNLFRFIALGMHIKK